VVIDRNYGTDLPFSRCRKFGSFRRVICRAPLGVNFDADSGQRFEAV
jgi:hypothetical protein